MDPHIRDFETIREDDEEVVVKTGFETTIRKRFDLPMPEQVSWETDTIEKLEAFEFDDPAEQVRVRHALKSERGHVVAEERSHSLSS